MKNFTSTDANDFRSGEGVSNTTTDSISQDLRTMKDAVHAYNKHHDVSGHASVEAAITERLSSNKQFFGKLVEFGSGFSIEGSATARAQGSTTHSAQWFNNSSEGQAFNKAFNHMLATAQNSHLDTSDTRNLSSAEQIGANFASGKSLLEQSSSEYSHGQQLQQAASHATENARSIDDNLNQVYHDWVVARYGAHGEQVMLQADSASIATQHQWANDFLNSSTGHDAVSSQVTSALSKTGADVHADYQHRAALIKQSSEVRQQYQRDVRTVETKESRSGLAPMSQEQMTAAKNIQERHRLKSVTEERAAIVKTTNHALDGTDKTIKNKHKKLNKEQ